MWDKFKNINKKKNKIELENNAEKEEIIVEEFKDFKCEEVNADKDIEQFEYEKPSYITVEYEEVGEDENLVEGNEYESTYEILEELNEKINNEDLSKYENQYSAESLFDKVKNVAKKAGIKVIYAGLILYYTLEKSSTPLWAKSTIVGSLGYFISFIDIIPDVIPIAGYSDDLGMLMVAILAVSMYIDEKVKTKAKNQLKVWFGDFAEDELADIDEKLGKKDSE